VALGVIKARAIEKDPILLILPADHVIKNIDQFINTINKGFEFAEKGNIVTFGIKPKSAETGFGYIESSNPNDFIKGKATCIKRFIEKPNKEKAEELILDSKFSWNSGIFIMKANVVFDEMQKLAPKVLKKCEKSIAESFVDLDFLRMKKDIFKECPDISFDIAIMEKTKLGIVLLLDIEWSDVGSWDSIWKLSKKDDNGNSSIGNVFIKKTKNCYIRSENKLVVGLDIEDLIIIETSDSVLVTKKGSSQKVKEIVEFLKINNIKQAITQNKIYRPRGNYLSIAEGETGK
jgi:Mannose-1-phosphate guanylyltransferase